MAGEMSKTKPKRLSKGQRLHVRRLKQAARKEANMNNPSSNTSQPVRVKAKTNPSL